MKFSPFFTEGLEGPKSPKRIHGFLARRSVFPEDYTPYAL